MSKSALKDVAKQLETATKELSKEQHDWKVKKGELQRDSIHLKAVNKDLTEKNKTLKAESETLASGISMERERKLALESKNTELERENHRLEEEVSAVQNQLDAVKNELATKQANLDTELEEYALERKKIIKDSILVENDKLMLIKMELKSVDEDLEAKKTELRELNQVYIEEQLAMKDSTAETSRVIEENRQKIIESKQELKDLQLEVNKLQFEKDNVMITITKAKAEHEKFLDYEKKARKLLDTKDRQLQERQADIDQNNQFLKNQRSVLSEL